jgi:GNAT superfamily N-acetyltransferase
MAVQNKNIHQLSLKEMPHISSLFQNWNETMIWSCLQGYMGNAYVSDSMNPSAAQVVVGDFCFFAGLPDRNLVHHIPTGFPSKEILMIPQSEEWSTLIEQVWNSDAVKIKRCAIKKEPDVFDRVTLQSYIDILPQEYILRMIDEEIYNQIMAEDWFRDLCSVFAGSEDYQRNGLGVAVLHNGIPVAGASSYTVYDKGIEIEIDTQPAYRRKGLALACGAKLILECLNRGLYPSWDAHDMRSVALAEKLGYHFDKEYTAYLVRI